MKSKEEILNKIIEDLPIQEFRGKMTDYEWYGWFEEAFNKGYALALQLQQTGVSQQREQLISFLNWYKDDPKELSNNETLVDAYLEEINCG